MLLYGLLYLFGYGLTLDDIKNFRQWDSLTPGHPEYRHTPGVETTTGPLGQGLATAVGMASAEKSLSARFNRPGSDLVSHRTWVFCSDGDLMEGLSHEAASLAGHLRLGRLKVLWDDNRISIEGSTSIAFTEDVLKRFEAYGWRTLRVENGNDLEALDKAFGAATADDSRPVLIACRTVIGYGSPLADSAKCHGAPLSPEAVAKTKEFFSWPATPTFYVPPAALNRCAETNEHGKAARAAWEKLRSTYSSHHAEAWAEWKSMQDGFVPDDLESRLPIFPPDAKGLATRAASGKILNSLAKLLPGLIGGSADLAESNLTRLEDAGDFQDSTPEGRNLHFGVREGAMAAFLNGMALHGGFLPYGATFLIFADYLRPALRLSHLMGLRVVYVLTHDSIGVGEDGPTHQPVETLASLRALPRSRVFRPADANETVWAWIAAVRRTDGPTCLALSRQNLPILDRAHLGGASGTLRGAYVLSDRENARVVLMGSGSEVSLCLKAQTLLDGRGIPSRVISAPCLEAFASQDGSYQESVLPTSLRARVMVEAGVSFGLHRWVGATGECVALDRFGASGPADECFRRFGFTPENVVAAALRSLEKSGQP
jgi:transketolase